MTTPAKRELIIHFGEMGSRWGVNRTVGQIHALLWLSHAPLTADDICLELGFSRSNVSMALKELTAWNLVERGHIDGDRRDHFTALGDLRDMVRVLVAERRKRELDPTLSRLRDLELSFDGTARDVEEAHVRARIAEMREMMERVAAVHDDVERLDNRQIQRLLDAGPTLLGLADTILRLFGRGSPRSDPGAQDIRERDSA